MYSEAIKKEMFRTIYFIAMLTVLILFNSFMSRSLRFNIKPAKLLLRKSQTIPVFRATADAEVHDEPTKHPSKNKAIQTMQHNGGP